MKRVWAIQWHITTRCNQKCRHCYIFNSPDGEKEIQGEKRMTWGILKKVADDIGRTTDNFGAKCKAALTGGDPLLHPKFFDLVSYLTGLGIEVSIMGNPWTINEKTAKRLVANGITTFQLSIDGMRRIHDFWRKKGSFDKTISAIKILKNSGIKVAIMTTVSKNNAADVPKIIGLVADKLRISVYAFARYVPTHGDADNNFSPREYRQFLDKIWVYYERRVGGQTAFHLKDHLWKLYLHEKGLFCQTDTDGIVMSGCSLGIGHLSILADGAVYACRRFHSPIGRVPEEKLADIFFNDRMEMYRNLEELEKCRNCFLRYYCRGCMAVSYGTTGDWRKPDPQCWL